MELPKYVDCKNNKEPCDWYMNTTLCENTCMLSIRLAQGISHSARTGLVRHLAKKERAKQKGFDWDNLRCLLPSQVPNEIKGEYKN